MITIGRFYYQLFTQRLLNWWSKSTANKWSFTLTLTFFILGLVWIGLLWYLPYVVAQLPLGEQQTPAVMGALYILLFVTVGLLVSFTSTLVAAANDLYGQQVPLVVRNAPGGAAYWWLQYAWILVKATVPVVVMLPAVGVWSWQLLTLSVSEILGLSGLLLLLAILAGMSGVLVLMVVRAVVAATLAISIRRRLLRILIASIAGAVIVVVTAFVGYSVWLGQPGWLTVSEGVLFSAIGLVVLGVAVTGAVTGIVWYHDVNRLSDATTLRQAGTRARVWFGTRIPWQWPETHVLVLVQAQVLRIARDARYWVWILFILTGCWVSGWIGHMASIGANIDRQPWLTIVVLGMLTGWSTYTIPRVLLSSHSTAVTSWRSAVLATPAPPLWWQRAQIVFMIGFNLLSVSLLVGGWWLIGIVTIQEWWLVPIGILQAIGFAVWAAWSHTAAYVPKLERKSEQTADVPARAHYW